MATTRSVAFFRGINVGKAKRVPMSAIVSVLEDLGARDIRTVLASGNAIFTHDGAIDGEQIRAAISRATGVDARVIMVSADAVRAAIDEHPFRGHPSKTFVAFLAGPQARARVRRIDASDGEFTVGRAAAHLSCPSGVAKSALWAAVTAEDDVTTRTLSTMERIAALL